MRSTSSSTARSERPLGRKASGPLETTEPPADRQRTIKYLNRSLLADAFMQRIQLFRQAAQETDTWFQLSEFSSFSAQSLPAS
jgi:hypothetical protein